MFNHIKLFGDIVGYCNKCNNQVKYSLPEMSYSAINNQQGQLDNCTFRLNKKCSNCGETHLMSLTYVFNNSQRSQILQDIKGLFDCSLNIDLNLIKEK